MRRVNDVQQTLPTPPLVFVQEQPNLPTPRPSPPRTNIAQKRQRQRSTSPLPALAVSVAQRAACYFAANFILVPSGTSRSHGYGYMEYLIPLVGASPPDSALNYAFNACAFAALGNRVKADGVNFSSISLEQHTLALTKTGAALGNPATANSDATLAAVLLLSVYEVGPIFTTGHRDSESGAGTSISTDFGLAEHHGIQDHETSCVADAR